MSKNIRMTEEQWREDCAKRARWQRGSEVVNTDQRGMADAGASGRATPAAANPTSTPAAPSSNGVRAVKSVAHAGTLYALVSHCRAHGLPEPVPEYQFHPTRKWRFDYAWPLHRVYLEVEGGVWIQGRHNRGAGIIEDMKKYSEAAILGWRGLRVIPQELGTTGVDYVRRALKPDMPEAA